MTDHDHDDADDSTHSVAGPGRHLPRRAPSVPFPAYAYRPGRTPHPTRDPAGHGRDRGAAPDVTQGFASLAFRHGADLYHHGFFWEAHEMWEGLWHAAGRRGPEADIYRGLIRLAAAAFKAREGAWHGVARHAAAAAQLLAGRATATCPLDLVGLADAIGRMERDARSGGPITLPTLEDASRRDR
ncbi:MAG: DUF309 domain-containing protein [Alphaproteobacteria bacterium]|nr:DUF309 domain-containing protein [Alphaproteobacteria bacterium]